MGSIRGTEKNARLRTILRWAVGGLLVGAVVYCLLCVIRSVLLTFELVFVPPSGRETFGTDWFVRELIGTSIGGLLLGTLVAGIRTGMIRPVAVLKATGRVISWLASRTVDACIWWSKVKQPVSTIVALLLAGIAAVATYYDYKNLPAGDRIDPLGPVGWTIAAAVVTFIAAQIGLSVLWFVGWLLRRTTHRGADDIQAVAPKRK